MKRPAASLVVIAAAVAAAAGSALGADGGAAVTDSSSRFPDRSLRIELPERQRLNPANVKVTENGGPVADLKVTPAGEQTVAMLLIDASLTMKGGPMADALRAARAFAARRNPAQRIGIATFNAKVDDLLPFTSSQSAINTALAQTPQTAYGTVIYDAVEHAAERIEASRAEAGTIVLLADGQNVGSKAKLEDAIRRLKERNIRLFSVALRSPAYYGLPLRRMARTSGGTYSEVFNSKGLERVYDALGARLANEYYASYRSLAKADTRVRVAVRLPGHPVFTSSYDAPPLSVTMTPVETSRFDEVLTSWPFALLLVAVIVGLLAYAVRSVLAVRRASLRERMAQFIEMPGEDVSLLSREELSARLRDFEDSIERTGFAERFAERCDIGFVTTKPSTLLLGSFAASASLSLMLSVTWSPWWIVLMPVGPIAVWLYVDDRVRAQRSLFQEQLPDNLEVLAAALRVGHSLAGGLQHMAEDTAEPSKREFRRVVTDEQLGVALEDALLKVATRMESRDMEHVSLVARLQRETGGASAEVIDQVTANIRGRMEVRRLVRTLTAQGRLARWIVSLMPLAVIALILIVYPAYLEPLFEKTVGLVALLIAGIMVVLGSYVIKRIVEIHV